VSAEAVLQIEEIVAYIARDSDDVADKVNAAFVSACELLARNPGLGHTRSDMTSRPLKFWSVHSYLIAYDVATAPLEIVAVFRGSRRPGQWLG
jgi:plasmid stabilization system protein ParE